MKDIYPKITLVGAGPGDLELITVKGLKAIQEADVILYDALVNPALLKEAKPSAIKLFVGKRASQHRFSQDEINQLIVSLAKTHGNLVRLKGGDPFVFGRGHEELAFAQSFGIETVVVPGISSCISVPELQNVPVTRRGINESFWVLTATTRSGALSNDLTYAAQSSATAVILMGISKITEIAQLFASQGKSNTPVMVVQNGSLPNERYVLGTIDTIVEKVQQAEIGAPGIIVVGEVVGLHQDFEKSEAKAAINQIITTALAA